MKFLFLGMMLTLAALAQGQSSHVEAGISAEPGTAQNWSALAATDLNFIHESLGANHPGPVDNENPGFLHWYEDGYGQALALADQAQDYAGYYYSIQHYLTGFQDGHLWALESPFRDERIGWSWPGFVLAYKDGEFEVSANPHGSPDVLRQGDRLISCDNRSAASLADEKLRGYTGLWSVAGARPALAPYLLSDSGNPFVDRPDVCRFETQSGVRSVHLDWREISGEELRSQFTQAQQRFVPELGIRNFGDDAIWIGLPSFDGAHESTADGLRSMISELESNADAYRRANVIVFDVRGNRGGSSSYGHSIASAIWGEEYIDFVAPQADYVEWRASDENINFIADNQLADTLQEYGPDHEYAVYYRALINGMRQSMERGGDYHSTNFAEDRPDRTPETVIAQIYLLTDSYCASACLGFVDILRAIPQVDHLGLETNADAVYIDIAEIALPSGLGNLTYPMKVYRGRPRGHNQSYQPHQVWHGGMTDTAAIESWVLNLSHD